ncbi:MAG: DUF2974 domain-containing protein [Spirochaetaceae bacterium]|jgi:hypothetical protein|nr:DUF2974 domain-containing protein [Spirochaetaceae bacterium]
MASLFDYLAWRGDLRFSAAPFNPVDNILFSILSYCLWEGIVGGIGGDDNETRSTVTIGEAATVLLGEIAEKRKRLNMTFIFKENLRHLLEVIRDAPRFADTRLRAYVNHFDKKIEKQFSAITFIPEAGDPYIAFRGTDDSIIGWKEDFNMVFSEAIPAQREAVDYLEKAARLFRGTFNTGGHSKGGNLAVYAATFCSKRVRKRIRNIYNNDGPGITGSIAARPEYAEIMPRIITFIPQTSIVGLLFEHKDDYIVVESTEKGILQHNPFSWNVMRNDFRRLDSVTAESRSINETLTHWLAGMDQKRRRHFIDALFAVFKETGVSSIDDLTADRLKSAANIIKAVQRYDKETKEMLFSTFASLFDIVSNRFRSILKKSVKNARLKLPLP